MSWTREEADRAFVEVRKRAMIDKAFRDLVLANPNLAIEQVSGKSVPSGIKIRVIESDPAAHLTFVLPPMVSDELASEDLEKVAGGVCNAHVGGDCYNYVCTTDSGRS